MKPSVEFRDVSIRFAGGYADLFSAISFDIHPGEVVVLAGPNGCGKSTILRLIAGMLRPTRGTVCVFGADPAAAQRTPEVGLIVEPFHPQQSTLPVSLTGTEVLNWVRQLDEVCADHARQLGEALHLSGPLMARPINRMSKGERQRVLLMVVLLRKPRLILADEPLDGLDSTSRKLISEQLRTYTADEQQSVLWVSHHLSETLPFVDRFLEVDGATIVTRPLRRFQVTHGTAGEESRTTILNSLDGLGIIAAEELRHTNVAHLQVHSLDDVE